MENITIEEQEELKEIASYIRNDINNKDNVVYVNRHGQIIIEQQIHGCETMYSLKTIMTELNRIRETYLSGFESNFEMVMKHQNPIIYCSYERNKIN